MTIAVILLVYAAGVGTAGSRLLGPARWAVRAPLLGIVIYLAAAWSVLAALGLVGLTPASATGSACWSRSRPARGPRSSRPSPTPTAARMPRRSPR